VPKLNEHYLNLKASYLFSEIRRRTKVFGDAHPDARLIDLGVGDVTQPLPPAVIRAVHAAADEMARAETFKGYGPYVGYEFLLAAIAAHDFGARGVKVGLDEIFVSDGGKSDSANLQEIFARDSVVALMDPVYPVYADSNVVAGRSGPADESGRYAGFVYLPCTAENAFQPALPAGGRCARRMVSSGICRRSYSRVDDIRHLWVCRPGQTAGSMPGGRGGQSRRGCLAMSGEIAYARWLAVVPPARDLPARSPGRFLTAGSG